MRNVLNKLGWKYSEYSNRFQGCCPLHGGDNETALSIDKKTGLWNCFTRACQKTHGAPFHCFVKAYIEKHSGQIIDIEEIYKWIEENPLAQNVNCNDIKRIKEPKIICTREDVLNRLQIPSPYYIKRGFSVEILKRHDIGYSHSPGPMQYRHIIPVYNHYYTGVIGCSGRLETRDKNKRWRHSKNFPRNLSLYNSWFAESYVKTGGTIFITEGPAKVWRLEEAGFMNSVAVLGTAFTISQKKILSRMGPEKIYLLMDNDKAGQKTAQNLVDELKDLYHIENLITPFEDLDREPLERVKEFINEINPDRN